MVSLTPNERGTSVLIIAKSRDNLPISWSALMASPTLPLISSAWAIISSKLPYSWMSLTAVFSPIPLMPGRLSLASPLSPL